VLEVQVMGESGSDASGWSDLLNVEMGTVVRCLVLLAVGVPIFYAVSRIAGRAMKRRFSDQASMLVRKGVFYFGLLVLLFMVLQQLKFNMTALLGTAGIVGIAIGFASQTSVSNIISGIFLIWEKPFAIGDVIKVGDTAGFVLSIDLLSVKLRTFDNRYIRIPNETLIKTELTNITRFPIRRLDINVGVAYKEDIARVIQVLRDIADKNPYCLDEPEPFIMFMNFGDSALEILFGVWFAKEQFLNVRRTIMQQIKERFDAEGIEIPFPHRTVYTGSVTEPFPIRLVRDSGEEAHPDSRPKTGDTDRQD
jgi:small-conductance mechanosensitive channel